MKNIIFTSIIGIMHFFVAIYTFIFTALSQPNRESYMDFYSIARPHIAGKTVDLAMLIALIAVLLALIDVVNIIILSIKKVYAIIKKESRGSSKIVFWLAMMAIAVMSLVAIMYKLILSF